jgi:methylmalonyl-CoA mutase N-terminal domain/subunit
VDEFAPRLSFFFNSHNDFFEEIAKFRAARRLWAHLLRHRFGASDERSLKLRFHAQTAGCSLTWQQPNNNVVRTTTQALAAVLGGAQSLHTNSLDEAYALPGEEAVTLALRTQQILAYESGAANVADPLGGSHFVEALTDELERLALDYIRRIDDLGGMIPAIERNFPQSEIADASYRYQREVESGARIVVGVNRFTQAAASPADILTIDPSAEDRQVRKLAALRSSRDNAAATAALQRLQQAAAGSQNTVPFLLEAVQASATTGEICDAFARVFGSWRESSAV